MLRLISFISPSASYLYMLSILVIISAVFDVLGVDDSTISLMAKVDPLPSGTKATSLIQAAASASTINRFETTFPVKGIQSRAMNKQFEYTVKPPTKNLAERRSIRVAPRIHLAEKTSFAVGPSSTVVPDVLICALPADKNGLSVRTCDMATQSKALLSQVLRCSDRVHPSTVVDLLMGRQQSPIDFAEDAATAAASLRAMETPVSVDVSFPSCQSDRSLLPNLDTQQDYVAFVVINPEVERSAENFSLIRGASASFRSGIVFVSVPKLFDDSVNLKGVVANGFSGPIENCLKDGVCAASELVEWTNSAYPPVDFLVGTSQGIVRLTGTSRSQTMT